MKTIVTKIDREGPIQPSLGEAARILQQGGLVAFPTETVYGLGADALNAKAAERIYKAKGRPSDNPLIVHICDMADLERITTEIPPKARLLAERYWPGPLTMIFKKNAAVPLTTTGGLDTVAVRMPRNEIALELIRCSTRFIAAPSANTSGRPSPTTADHVYRDLEGKIPLILDGGAVGIGIESTIVDFTGEMPTILRPGYITREEIASLIGEVQMDPALESKDPTLRPKAPGMKYRHYAPKAPLTLFRGQSADVTEAINKMAYQAEEQGKKVGILATEETAKEYPRGVVRILGSRENELSVAQRLYGVLRELDELKVDVIFSECFSDDGVGEAIMNRMRKAAGQQLVDVSPKAWNAYHRILFVGRNGTSRAMMAEAIFKEYSLKHPVEVGSRGLVVLFPEPMNQKVETVLISNGITPEGKFSQAFTHSDITPDTLVIVMEEALRLRLLRDYPGLNPSQVQVLTQMVGEELEILDPYGGSLPIYGMCHETMNKALKKFVTILNEGE